MAKMTKEEAKKIIKAFRNNGGLERFEKLLKQIKKDPVAFIIANERLKYKHMTPKQKKASMASRFGLAVRTRKAYLKSK